MSRVDVLAENAARWDNEVAKGNRWTLPVDPETIARARRGDWSIVLTNVRPVPRAWFPDPLAGARVLLVGGGGGQQGPVLAAAGARVTVFDNSPRQLARDAEVAAREGLALRVEQGDMADLSRFPDASFDLVVNPASTCFVPDVEPVWRECARVLRPGGDLLAGLVQPVTFLFDPDRERDGLLVVRFPIPHSDAEMDPAERERLWPGSPLGFGHTLGDLIGGQLRAGLALLDLYEDDHGGERIMDQFIPGLLATRARKPRSA